MTMNKKLDTNTVADVVATIKRIYMDHETNKVNIYDMCLAFFDKLDDNNTDFTDFINMIDNAERKQIEEIKA